MKNTEPDKFDELFRNKLYDFEAFPDQGDWARLDRRLSGKKSVAFVHIRRYMAAAVLLSFVAAGFYFISRVKNSADEMAAELSPLHAPAAVDTVHPVREKAPGGGMLASASGEKPVAGGRRTEGINEGKPRRTKAESSFTAYSGRSLPVAVAESPAGDPVKQVAPATGQAVVRPAGGESRSFGRLPADTPEEAQASSDEVEIRDRMALSEPQLPTPAPAKKTRSKGWGFGMGGGALTAGASNSLPAVAGMAFCSTEKMNSSLLKSEQALMNNVLAASSQRSLRTDIEHRTPVSFGMSVGKRLNDRFSLQSGLVYTYLASEWTTGGALNGKAKQKLHYLGIPLSVRYTIAEWNRFQVYASAGGMGEINVAGKTVTEVFDYEDRAIEDSEKTRMKEVLWSVRGNVGVSYPVVRFLHVFAEAGAAYYFDNGSDIETIRSEKPFNVDFNLGFRFGF